MFDDVSLGGRTTRSRTKRVSDRRIRQIVADALRRQQLDDPADHAIIQLMRLDAAHELAARAVDSAIYDDAARKRLFEKLNRVAAGFTVAEAPAGPEPSNPDGDAPPS